MECGLFINFVFVVVPILYSRHEGRRAVPLHHTFLVTEREVFLSKLQLMLENGHKFEIFQEIIVFID